MVRKSAGSVAVNYIYDVANRLIRVEDELSSLVIAEYGYDPFGRRLWKEVDGTRTYFFYSDEGLVAEYDESGNELRTYGYQPDSMWTTDPLWLKEGGQYYWYQNDHLGTPQKLIDINGTVVWSAQYTAFGEAQIQVETVTNNLRFPGQYEDAETGLHYNWFRYYDPEIGRYLRVDPIGLKGGINLYMYGNDNPLKHFDPNGLQTHGLRRCLPTDDCPTLLQKMERLVASLRQRRDEMEPFCNTGQPWQPYVGHTIQILQQYIMLQNCQILYIFHEPPCSEGGYPDYNPFPLPAWRPEPYPPPRPVPVVPNPMPIPLNIPELSPEEITTGLALAGAAYALMEYGSGGGGCGRMCTELMQLDDERDMIW